MRRAAIALAGAALAAALAVAAGEAAAAESLEGLFDEANAAFWNGEYDRAAELYARLEELGARSSALSYNRATAEARRGRLGVAIQHYERALRRDPGHEDAVHNLAVLREFIARRASEAGRDADLAPAVGPWRALLDRFSPAAAALLFLVFEIALFALLVLRRFVAAEMPRMALGVLAGVLALLTAATLAVSVGKYRQQTGPPEAVVVESGVLRVKEGPSSDVERFLLEEGSRVVVAERRDGWVRLRDDQGRDGWAPAESLGEI